MCVYLYLYVCYSLILLYLYTYIYLYMYMLIYTCICICLYTYIHIYQYICIFYYFPTLRVFIGKDCSLIEYFPSWGPCHPMPWAHIGSSPSAVSYNTPSWDGRWMYIHIRFLQCSFTFPWSRHAR